MTCQKWFELFSNNRKKAEIADDCTINGLTKVIPQNDHGPTGRRSSPPSALSDPFGRHGANVNPLLHPSEHDGYPVRIGVFMPLMIFG
jgi:hypothetical protein